MIYVLNIFYFFKVLIVAFYCLLVYMRILPRTFFYPVEATFCCLTCCMLYTTLVLHMRCFIFITLSPEFLKFEILPLLMLSECQPYSRYKLTLPRCLCFLSISFLFCFALLFISLYCPPYVCLASSLFIHLHPI